jgi:hypothetical protein
MKTKIVSKIVFALTLVFLLGGAITHVDGETQESAASVQDQQLPVVTIQSVSTSGVVGSAVARGQIGVFVLSANPPILLATTFVNFKVSGTAIPGVDYSPVVSPTFIGQSGFGTILIKTLPDPRAGVIAQPLSVMVTLEHGQGYAVGQPSSAKILIAP